MEQVQKNYLSQIDEIKNYIKEGNQIKISAYKIIEIGVLLFLYPIIYLLLMIGRQQITNDLFLFHYDSWTYIYWSLLSNWDGPLGELQYFAFNSLILMSLYYVWTKFIFKTSLVTNLNNPFAAKINKYYTVLMLVFLLFGYGSAYTELEFTSVQFGSFTLGGFFFIAGMFGHRYIKYLGLALMGSGLLSLLLMKMLISRSLPSDLFFLIHFIPSVCFLFYGLLMLVENKLNIFSKANAS